MKIYIEKNQKYTEKIKYIFRIFAIQKNISFEFVQIDTIADIIISHHENADFIVSNTFYDSIDFIQYFKNDCFIYTKNKIIDYFTSCFYMINSMQEWDNTTYDDIGRFRYLDSYQFKFGVITKNLVQNYFDILYSHEKFKHCKIINSKTRIFISHDIDNLYNGWLEDGFAAVKKGRFDILLTLLIKHAINKPNWFNIDQIINIHNEYDLKSTFFWIANKGKVNSRIVNADYDISQKKIINETIKINSKGFENGIHKSASAQSFKEEMLKLPFQAKINRYHYLKFNLPDAYFELEKAGILLDSSLGFAESYGFRNSYGQAFQPYNFKEDRPFNFIEVPLNVMDRTFYNYTKEPTKNVSKKVIDFLDQNQFNCTLSLLWHNNFFNSFKYKGYLEEYKKIIGYLYESNLKSISSNEIINKYLIV